jgi:hypothetical protein
MIAACPPSGQTATITLSATLALASCSLWGGQLNPTGGAFALTLTTATTTGANASLNPTGSATVDGSITIGAGSTLTLGASTPISVSGTLNLLSAGGGAANVDLGGTILGSGKRLNIGDVNGVTVIGGTITGTAGVVGLFGCTLHTDRIAPFSGNFGM